MSNEAVVGRFRGRGGCNCQLAAAGARGLLFKRGLACGGAQLTVAWQQIGLSTRRPPSFLEVAIAYAPANNSRVSQI